MYFQLNKPAIPQGQSLNGFLFHKAGTTQLVGKLLVGGKEQTISATFEFRDGTCVISGHVERLHNPLHISLRHVPSKRNQPNFLGNMISKPDGRENYSVAGWVNTKDGESYLRIKVRPADGSIKPNRPIEINPWSLALVQSANSQHSLF